VKVKYKLKKLLPGIYHIEIKDRYDLAMTFCRVQEFYESPFKQIRGKVFNLVEFMALYAKKTNCSYFSYPDDWGGFNIPGPIVNELYSRALSDHNFYDDIIASIHDSIVDEHRSIRYYLIGSDGDKTTVAHEVCHGLFNLNEQYKKNTLKLIKTIPEKIQKKLAKALITIGYCKQVIPDEIQAYLSTDFSILIGNLTEKEVSKLDTISKEFVKNLKVFYKIK